MKLEAGEYYLSANGEIIKIKDMFYKRYVSSSGIQYLQNGKYIHNTISTIGRQNLSLDLIAHIPKELHLHILNEINSFYTDKDFMETVKSVWGAKR